MKDVHNYDEWKRDLHHAIMLDCNKQWSWDFMQVPMVPECLFWPAERPPCPDSGFWFWGASALRAPRGPQSGVCLLSLGCPSQHCNSVQGAVDLFGVLSHIGKGHFFVSLCSHFSFLRLVLFLCCILLLSTDKSFFLAPVTSLHVLLIRTGINLSACKR